MPPLLLLGSTHVVIGGWCMLNAWIFLTRCLAGNIPERLLAQLCRLRKSLGTSQCKIQKTWTRIVTPCSAQMLSC